MKLLETLKWLWDPRTEEEKVYEQAPLQRRTQELIIYIRDREEPFCCDYTQEDWRSGDWSFRRASDAELFDNYRDRWLADRGTKGIRVDSVWYSPESIVRIELGETVLEDL